MPKYSFIVPAYQSENTLENTVVSIQNAGLPDIEIVIIDDGSTDGTIHVCRKLQEKYSNVNYFYQHNSGVSVARNCGIQHAKGEFILFVDADDQLTPFDAQKLDDHFSAGADMVIFGMEFRYHRSGRCVRTEKMTCDGTMVLGLQDIGEQFSYLFSRNYLSSACNKIIRKSVLLDNEVFFNPDLINYEDLEFSIRSAMCCGSIVAIPDVHYVYDLTYGQDRTIQRVSRIPNIIMAVDPIANAMLALNERIGFDSNDICPGILEVMRMVYMDMLVCKMKTASLEQIREHCSYVRSNPNIARCMSADQLKDAVSLRLLNWLLESRTVRIWTYFRYRNVRNYIVRHIKMLLGKY